MYFLFFNFFPFMQIDIKDLANLCKNIIKNPESNYKKIKAILNTKTESEEEKSLIFVSVFKVFKSIIPLYKIRTLKDKVKQKKDDLEITKNDKNLLKVYSTFINQICSDTSYTSFYVATQILDYFEHFNYLDVIVKKVLKGTLKNNKISEMCLSTIKKKIDNDINGELVFYIVNQMYETPFSPDALALLLNINLLKEFLVNEGKPKKDRFFKTTRSFKKEERKMEKKRRKIEEERRKEETYEEKQDGFVIHRKIIDGLQRLYFLILRDKIKQKFKHTFIGIRKYKKYIRQEFYEGLYILLNDSLNLSNYEEKLYCILTILDIYESYRYDFKNLVHALFNIIYPFNANIGKLKMLLIEQVIEHLFINIKQPIKRVHIILEKLLLFACIRYNPVLSRIIKKLGSFYDVDFLDKFKFNDNLDLNEEFDKKEIDLVEIRPLYCFEIFKKIL